MIIQDLCTRIRKKHIQGKVTKVWRDIQSVLLFEYTNQSVSLQTLLPYAAGN